MKCSWATRRTILNRPEVVDIMKNTERKKKKKSTLSFFPRTRELLTRVVNFRGPPRPAVLAGVRRAPGEPGRYVFHLRQWRSVVGVKPVRLQFCWAWEVRGESTVFCKQTHKSPVLLLSSSGTGLFGLPAATPQGSFLGACVYSHGRQHCERRPFSFLFLFFQTRGNEAGAGLRDHYRETGLHAGEGARGFLRAATTLRPVITPFSSWGRGEKPLSKQDDGSIFAL